MHPAAPRGNGAVTIAGTPQEGIIRLRTLIVGGAIGAALGYFFDPVAGPGRRMRLREQAIAKARDARAQAERRTQEHATDVEGAKTGSVDLADATVNDGTLEQRIRSTVLGSPDVPSESVTIEVVHGHVTLRGEVGSTAQADGIARRIETVPGVTAVDVLVHVPGAVARRTRRHLSARASTSRPVEPRTVPTNADYPVTASRLHREEQVFGPRPST